MKNNLFIAIPRTASTAIRKAMNIKCYTNALHKRHKIKNFLDNNKFVSFTHVNILDLIKHRIISKDKFYDCFKFAFVRNPWDRLVSLYFYFKKLITKNNKNKEDKKRSIWAQKDFTLFCSDLLIEKIDPIGFFNVKGISQCRPQHEWIFRKNKLFPEFIGKYENIEQDFNRLCKMLKIENKLEKVNTTNHENYKSYYTNETKKIVTKIYEKDIELFKYQF